jgi:hypothetical protein
LPHGQCWPARLQESWDLFGLDLAAAAEILRIAVDQTYPDALTRDTLTTRHAVMRLVEALADHLTMPDPAADATLASQLERDAAAVQLRRALDAVT